MSRAELKSLAKDQIRGNIGILFVCSLLITIMTSVASFVSWLVAGPFTLSMTIVFLNLTNGVRPQVEDVFSGFKNFGSAFATCILMFIFTWLWSLLFVVPGIIKGLSYSMAPYILAENPEMSATDCISASRELMNGHKGELFILELSFLPWFLLTCVTFGIAWIYVSPYIQATTANYYLSIRSNGQYYGNQAQYQGGQQTYVGPDL